MQKKDRKLMVVSKQRNLTFRQIALFRLSDKREGPVRGKVALGIGPLTCPNLKKITSFLFVCNGTLGKKYVC